MPDGTVTFDWQAIWMTPAIGAAIVMIAFLIFFREPAKKTEPGKVGTATPEGTFDAAFRHLPRLAALGATRPLGRSGIEHRCGERPSLTIRRQHLMPVNVAG